MDGSTADILRCADRTLPGATGAFLPVRLLPTPTNLTATLGGVGSLPRRGKLRHHYLVDERNVGGHIEQVGGQLDGSSLGAARIKNIDCAHAESPFLTALRSTTRPPLAPGIAPLIRIKPRSASTAWTARFCNVTRCTPIRPAIRRPLNTRPGVAQPPIEPGARCLRCTPWLARRPPKPCRFMTPAVPLPLLTPVASTTSFAANRSAVSSWPRVYSLASAVRISTRCLRGVTPALSKCPALGLVTCLALIGPKPS